MIDRNSVTKAAARISNYVRKTPILIESGGSYSNDAPVVLKLEMLQLAGSFKPRGAFNRMLSATIPGSGVIAASGGNHGAAVACAAQCLSLPAEIFVPMTTPRAKVARIESYGAHVVQTGSTYAEAFAASQDRQTATGALDIHAYDHADILSGQGTVGRELEQQAPDLTHVLVATGGGGLIGGIAAWYAGSAEVISVEPEACPALHDALRAGHPVDSPVSGLAADSLGARRVGDTMFPLAQQHVTEAVLVTDDSIKLAQRWLWERFRLVAEPGGATALAGLLSGRFQIPKGARIGVIVCGANTDPGILAH